MMLIYFEPLKIIISQSSFSSPNDSFFCYYSEYYETEVVSIYIAIIVSSVVNGRA